MGKQENLHIWNLHSRQQVLVGKRCVAVQSGCLSQVPLLAGPVMLLEDFSPGSGCHLPAPGSCQPLSPGTGSNMDVPSLTNKGKVVLSLSLKPGRLHWRSVPSHVVPLAALWLTGQEEINQGLEQCLHHHLQREELPVVWEGLWLMEVLDQSCLSTGLASSTEPSSKCGLWEVPMTYNGRERVKHPWKAAE